jgi:hypothetical protein
MVLGTLRVIESVAGAFALIATGFAGATRHCPEIALASQWTLTKPP